jgi:hypothetical protein
MSDLRPLRLSFRKNLHVCFVKEALICSNQWLVSKDRQSQIGIRRRTTLDQLNTGDGLPLKGKCCNFSRRTWKASASTRGTGGEE